MMHENKVSEARAMQRKAWALVATIKKGSMLVPEEWRTATLASCGMTQGCASMTRAARRELRKTFTRKLKS
jgi:hypothetical protein